MARMQWRRQPAPVPVVVPWADRLGECSQCTVSQHDERAGEKRRGQALAWLACTVGGLAAAIKDACGL